MSKIKEIAIPLPKEMGKIENFDLLRGCTVEAAKGNHLTVKKDDGTVNDFDICGFLDTVFLCKGAKHTEEICVFDDPKNKNPLADFVGRKIINVEKRYLDLESRLKDEPAFVKISAEGCPHFYEITNDDGTLDFTKGASISSAIDHVSKIIRKDLSDITDAEMHDLKAIERRLHIPIFDEKELAKYPDFQRRLHETDADTSKKPAS